MEKCKNWVQTALHGWFKGQWCPSQALLQSVNLRNNLKGANKNGNTLVQGRFHGSSKFICNV